MSRGHRREGLGSVLQKGIDALSRADSPQLFAGGMGSLPQHCRGTSPRPPFLTVPVPTCLHWADGHWKGLPMNVNVKMEVA